MRITTCDQLEEIVRNIQRKLALNGRTDFVEHYRGQSLDNYKLESGLARFSHKPADLREKEKKYLINSLTWVEQIQFPSFRNHTLLRVISMARIGFIYFKLSI